MNLTLKRTIFTDKSTIGELSINGHFQCYTLEDVVRNGVKVQGKTAIPFGEYELAVTFSNRFQKPLPLVLNVPMFEGIRIHPGNTDKDTEGCILVGTTFAPDFIGNSRMAFGLLFEKIKAAYHNEKIMLKIVDTRTKDLGL